MLIEKLKDFVFGKKCLHCKKGRLGLISYYKLKCNECENEVKR